MLAPERAPGQRHKLGLLVRHVSILERHGLPLALLSNVSTMSPNTCPPCLWSGQLRASGRPLRPSNQALAQPTPNNFRLKASASKKPPLPAPVPSTIPRRSQTWTLVVYCAQKAYAMRDDSATPSLHAHHPRRRRPRPATPAPRPSPPCRKPWPTPDWGDSLPVSPIRGRTPRTPRPAPLLAGKRPPASEEFFRKNSYARKGAVSAGVPRWAQRPLRPSPGRPGSVPRPPPPGPRAARPA